MGYSWSTKDLDELEKIYWDEIASEFRDDGFHPETETPTYQWLVDHGYSGLISHLQRTHDLSPTEFYDQRDIPPVAPVDDYWRVDHEPTREALETYIDELLERRGHPDSTVKPLRSRLKKFVRIYDDLHETDDLLTPLLNTDSQPDEIDRTLAVFDVLDSTLESQASKYKYLEDTRRFYAWLIDAGRAVYNPLERMERRFNWDRPEWDNSALSVDDISELSTATRTDKERLVVVGLAGWGLRPSELAAASVDQFVLDPPEDSTPYLSFDESRKNGPGTVSLLIGTDLVDRHLDQLANSGEWNGYLFPSATASSGHRSVETIRSWFYDIADRAGVTVDGDVPTPKMGRRYWYTQYGNAVSNIVDTLDFVADEQGSSSAEVVLSNYLSETERREHRQAAMKEALKQAFDPQ